MIEILFSSGKTPLSLTLPHLRLEGISILFIFTFILLATPDLLDISYTLSFLDGIVENALG